MISRFDMNLLLRMLTYARPKNSITERAFCREFIGVLPGAYVDTCGNWHVKIGESRVLWSCHTDTVHKTAGRQTLHYDAETGMVQLSKRSRQIHTCLGADDTAGVAILVQMARAGIPGHYLFHYGEETGGIGSQWIADNHGQWLTDTFDCAIALDRKDTGDVITHQYGRCCSDVFAQSLAFQLNAYGLKYAPSDRGVFTDTANYTDYIGECTNLSIGYTAAHSDKEMLDVNHCARLYEALCGLDTSKLTLERKPADPDDSLPWYYVGHDWAHVKDAEIVLPWPSNLRECCNCSKDFDYLDSDALEFDEFCSEDCERGYYSLFLDRSQARVQAAILSQIKRRVS